VSYCFHLITVEFARFPIRFLDRKPFDMGIAGDKPRQALSSLDVTRFYPDFPRHFVGCIGARARM
jgi:hypothetical protein